MRARRLGGVLLLGTLALTRAAPAAAQADPGALIERMQSAWAAHAVDDYLALWRFDSPAAREEERKFASDALAANETRVLFERPAYYPLVDRLRLVVRAFTVSEPRARVEQWGLVVERHGEIWRIRAREPAGRLDGLVHLSLDPHGFRAAGHVLRFEDCELRLLSGTLFTTPASLGPTALVFVGEGLLHIRPHPATEREQLRQFWGQPELQQRVREVFVRLNPADFSRVLTPSTLQPDPDAARRLGRARRFFDEHAASAFLLDADLPGAPWWALPSLGDGLLMFHSRKGVLSFTVSNSQPESISLFDRTRRVQICLYPARGRDTRYHEDAGREADALRHDLRVSFDPQTRLLRGEDLLRLRLLRPATSLRLRLKESLRVRSVVSSAGSHLFFRVRNQDSLVVALGPLGSADELSLRVTYDGPLDPGVPTDEADVPGQERRYLLGGGPLFAEDVTLYSNRALWYPQPADDDYAEAELKLDVPEGFFVVGPGERTESFVRDGRQHATYVLRQPGKYLPALVGRVALATQRQAGDVRLDAYTTPLRRADAPALLERAGQMLQFFSRLFGPCPYPIINVVLLQGGAPGGHSPPGMIVLTARSPFARERLADDPANFDDVPYFYLAHELAHQWWGQGVAGQNYRERWLSEGAAQYAAALWVQHAHGPRTFQSVLRRLSNWALREGQAGPIQLGFRLGHIQHDPQIYRAIVYDKGAYVLHMLRGLVGDEAFFQALRRFQQQHRFRKAGTADLREALELASGSDLRAYFDAWVHGTSVPRLRGELQTTSMNQGQRTQVTVRAADLPGPVPLELILRAGAQSLVRRVTVPPGGASFTFDTSFRPSRLELNTDGGLLAQIE